MKFTRDICRLLGLGGDGPGEDKMEVHDGAPAQTDRERGPSQVMLNSEEGLDDEEKTRKRAERRKAKRKRQKERRKIEREERMEDASEQEEEAAGDVTESDSEEEERERVVEERERVQEERKRERVEEEERERKRVVEEVWTSVNPRHRGNMDALPTPMTTTHSKSHQQLHHRTAEEEPEWDVSSAFVAKAASHIKLKGLKNRTTQMYRENKENEARNSQVETTEEMKRRGEALTVQGIQMFGRGLYSQAVDMFTEAIYCDPKDHRFYGNRSYCYWCLEQFSAALKDAQRSIQLAPDWPKGYFRKGCALMGLQRYNEAEREMDQVLKLDRRCKEASSKLSACRVMQLMELGFEEEQSKLLLEKFTTVEAVITSPLAKTLKQTSQQDQSGFCRSLWVGNITLEVTEKDVWDLFKMFGEIESIRVLHERFCAFVNFKNANMAAVALEGLQGVDLGGSKLVMRYPDRWNQRTLPPVQRTNPGLGPTNTGTQQSQAAIGSRGCAPINGDECFYWLTTGCFYGDKCRFKHIPEHQGRDKKP